MISKTLIAATAALVAAGTLAATTSSASAHYNSGGHYITKVVYIPQNVCKPYFKTIKWHDYYGWHTKSVYAGQNCYTVNVKTYQKVFVPYVSYNSNKGYGFKFSYGY
jgi:hypothetical protein